MTKISIYKEGDDYLVIYKTKNENLIGEVYIGGLKKRGQWDMRATFNTEDGDATEYRVCSYFGFDMTKSAYWRRWA